MREIPLHKSSTRHALAMGAEWEPLAILGMACASIAWIHSTWQAALVALLLWAVGLSGLRKLAKADPLMIRVALRHIRYKSYYPARSGVGSQGEKRNGSWY